MSVVESIVRHEGFRSVPYPDPIHGWKRPTFGHGITYITEDESLYIVRKRVRHIAEQLQQALPFWTRLPDEVKDVLIEMAYQMGVGGVLRFRKTLDALEHGDYAKAAEEMLDSKWAHQTPKRALELAERVRNVAANV